MSTDTTFAGRLKTLRESAGLSMHELARRAGLAQASISNLEAGKREPTWETVTRLASALGVSTERFRK